MQELAQVHNIITDADIPSYTDRQVPGFRDQNLNPSMFIATQSTVIPAMPILH